MAKACVSFTKDITTEALPMNPANVSCHNYLWSPICPAILSHDFTAVPLARLLGRATFPPVRIEIGKKKAITQ